MLVQARVQELQQRLDDSEEQRSGAAQELARACYKQRRLQDQLASSQQENTDLRDQVCLPDPGRLACQLSLVGGLMCWYSVLR